MTDYSKLLDAEVQAFIDKTNSYYPPETTDYTIGQQRDVYNRMCRAFFNGYPDGVTAADSSISAIPDAIAIRTYRHASTDTSARVLYMHGGGFILGGLDSHDDVCADISEEITGRYPGARLTFVGHTDSRGSEAANLVLSQDRARAVMNWFTQAGYSSDRMAAEGRGESEMLVLDTDAGGAFVDSLGQQNRRVEILIDPA